MNQLFNHHGSSPLCAARAQRKPSQKPRPLRAWSLVRTAATAITTLAGDGDSTNPLARELARPHGPRQAFAGMPDAAALRQVPSGRWSVLALGQQGALAARRSHRAAVVFTVPLSSSPFLQKSAPFSGLSQPVFIKVVADLYKASGPRQAAEWGCHLPGDELRGTVTKTEGSRPMQTTNEGL